MPWSYHEGISRCPLYISSTLSVTGSDIPSGVTAIPPHQIIPAVRNNRCLTGTSHYSGCHAHYREPTTSTTNSTAKAYPPSHRENFPLHMRPRIHTQEFLGLWAKPTSQGHGGNSLLVCHQFATGIYDNIYASFSWVLVFAEQASNTAFEICADQSVGSYSTAAYITSQIA